MALILNQQEKAGPDHCPGKGDSGARPRDWAAEPSPRRQPTEPEAAGELQGRTATLGSRHSMTMER